MVKNEGGYTGNQCPPSNEEVRQNLNKTKYKIEIKEDDLTWRTLFFHGNGGVVEVSQGSEVRRVAFLVICPLKKGRRRTHSDSVTSV